MCCLIVSVLLPLIVHDGIRCYTKSRHELGNYMWELLRTRNNEDFVGIIKVLLRLQRVGFYFLIIISRYHNM